MCMSERIKERRLLIGYTQEELAQKLGLQKSAIAKYENGRVENIKRTTISNMADILDTTPAYLMGWHDDPVDYDKLDIDLPSWWEGSVKDYLKYQQTLDKEREYDSAQQSGHIAKDESERRLLMLCRKAGDIPKEEKEAILKNFESTIDMYLRAKGIKKE